MRVHQQEWQSATGWSDVARPARLVMCFGERSLLQDAGPLEQVYERYPDALVVACSAGGTIASPRVLDDALAVTAVDFAHSDAAAAGVELDAGVDEYAAGRLLGDRLNPQGLAHVLLFAPGTDLNAARLLAGVSTWLPAGVTVTGGLASDGAAFERTFVAAGRGKRPAGAGRQAVAVGLYGARLNVAFGSMGGWDTFGPDRTVTRSRGNVLLELDGQPALTLYKRYLGDHAAGLPGSGLLFPLSIRNGDEAPVVRTLLNVDNDNGSITLAGDIPEGCAARLMRGNLERLIDGAAAAATAAAGVDARADRLALLVSCIGRRLVLKQRVEEELEAVQNALSPGTALAGFYSNGELCPVGPGRACSVHNQTMTVTTIGEA